MMNADQIFDLLIEANPVPDPGVVSALEELHPHDRRRNDMQTHEAPTMLTPPTEPRRRGWAVVLGAAAALVLAVVAVLQLTADDRPEPAIQPAPSLAPEPSVPVPPPAADPTVASDATQVPEQSSAPGEPDDSADAERRAAAVTKVEGLWQAMLDGDIEQVADIVTDGTGDIDVDDRNIYEWQTVYHAAYPPVPGSPGEIPPCEATTDTGIGIVVECEISFAENESFSEFGIGALTSPYDVMNDGTVRWRAYEPELPSAAVSVYGRYLQTFHPDEWADVCDPGPYYTRGEAVFVNGGIALTGACAELAVPLTPDMAEWVRAGEPLG